MWRICGANTKKPPQRIVQTAQNLSSKITRHVVASLYVPIPSLPHSKAVLLSLLPSSTVAKCRLWTLVGIHPSAPASRAATVSLRSPQRNPLAFPISQGDMYTPLMTLSIANRCRATLEKLLSTVPNRKTAPGYALLPEIELALASGWTRKDVWESLTSDGLEVSYKTFNTIIRRARKKPAQPRHAAGERRRDPRSASNLRKGRS